jgi:inhibitor of cysteine peptidase
MKVYKQNEFLLITGDNMSIILPRITLFLIYSCLSMITMALFATPIAANQQPTITEEDNGKTMYIKTGIIFYLRLKENPSTGYSWQLSLSKGLSLLMDKYYSPESSKRDKRFVFGAAGFHSWEIKTIAKGRQQIKGIYKRTWEKEASKEQTFKFYVKTI